MLPLVLETVRVAMKIRSPWGLTIHSASFAITKRLLTSRLSEGYSIEYRGKYWLRPRAGLLDLYIDDSFVEAVRCVVQGPTLFDYRVSCHG